MKVVEKIKNTHFVFNNFFLRKSCRFGIMLENTVQPGRPQTKIWRMRCAFWITKATDTYSRYVILTAFPLQQRLHDRASVLRYTCIACRVQLWCRTTKLFKPGCRNHFKVLYV